MARTGDTIEHPVTGERIEFLTTAQDTGGESLRMELLVEPRGFAAAEHVHPRQDERFEILSGTLRYRVVGVEREADAGDTLVIPKGVPHVWENGGDEDLRMILEFRPALRSEQFFESYFGLGQDGKTDPKTGLPNPIRMAVLLNEFRDEIHLARPPLCSCRGWSSGRSPSWAGCSGTRPDIPTRTSGNARHRRPPDRSRVDRRGRGRSRRPRP